MKRAIKVAIALGIVFAVVYVLRQSIWKWGICRVWCPPGKSLVVTRKTGKPAAKDHYADENKDEAGVIERMRGPGRSFLNPWTYDARVVDDAVIPAGQMLQVSNRFGEDLPEGQRLAEPHQKGIRRQMLTPGRWRLNPDGVEWKKEDIVPATRVEPGYVGVQTINIGPQKQVLKTVLPAGIYYNNPIELTITPIEVGYRVWESHTETETAMVDEGGVRKQVQRVKPGTGVSFSLADGKQMQIDIAVVWGIWPEQAPRVVADYGSENDAEQKVIIPQLRSKCEQLGSNLTTQQFIEGETREQFQADLTKSLQEIGKQKGLEVLIALVRGFHPDEQIKTTIQNARLAQEEKITLAGEQKRDTVSASLEEAKKMVDVAVRDFNAETEALVKGEMENGLKKAAETKADTDMQVAQIKRQIAEIQAEITKTVGEAEAAVIRAEKEAEAKGFELEVQAYGGADTYVRAQFAENLPQNMNITFLPVGPGTLWTNPGSLVELAAARSLATRPAK